MKVALCWYPLKENKINKNHITEVIALQSACQITNDFISLQPMQLPSKPLNYSCCYEAQLLRCNIRTLYCCSTLYNYANIVPIAKLYTPFKIKIFTFKHRIIYHLLRFSCNISNTSDSVSGYPNTEKRVENTTRSGVFLTKFEVFG